MYPIYATGYQAAKLPSFNTCWIIILGLCQWLKWDKCHCWTLRSVVLSSRRSGKGTPTSGTNSFLARLCRLSTPHLANTFFYVGWSTSTLFQTNEFDVLWREILCFINRPPRAVSYLKLPWIMNRLSQVSFARALLFVCFLAPLMCTQIHFERQQHNWKAYPLVIYATQTRLV